MTGDKRYKLNKKRLGFTLTEMLVVVAILVVLFCIVMLSLTTVKRNLRQKELDSKAQIIYVAAQNRMSQLRASGFETLYAPRDDGSNGVKHLGLIPMDADETSDIDQDTICYVLSEGKNTSSQAASSILPASSVDYELWSHEWIIEFDPGSGTVYGVFYSELSSIENADDPAVMNRLRLKSKRLSDGAVIGYYGGDNVSVDSTDTLEPSIDIKNEEKLTATFYCNNPYGDELTFIITVTDGAGGTYTKTVSNTELVQLNSKTYYWTWVMDSLETDDTRFAAQTGLTAGTDISIKLTVKCSNPLVDQNSYSRTTNSLFDYRPGTPSDTALISYGRHLQNLDLDSGVTANIKNAIQISDVSFQDDADDDEDWYSFYGDSYKPVNNPNLVSYDGYSELGDVGLYSSIYGLHIVGAEGGAGVFETFSGEILNVTMTGTEIDGGASVGALAGYVTGDTTIENCRVYLSSKRGDLTGITPASEPVNVTPWLTGKTAGGLVGTAEEGSTLKISGSFASTVIRADDIAGGLVGKAGGELDVSESYSDSYLTGKYTGGVAGSAGTGAAISIENVYTAGYQVSSMSGAGFVPGKMTKASSSYSACSYSPVAGSRVYTTAASIGSASRVYYLSGAGYGTGRADAAGTTSRSYREMSDSSFTLELSDAFTSSTGDASNPYNLMDQGLTYYSYPRLSALGHYGDWQAEFESGALVYYEYYGGTNYGFSGANISTKSNFSKALGDGYALAFIDDPGDDWTETITYAGGLTYEIDSSVRIPVTYEGTTYYLVPLPKEIVNSNYVDTSAPDSFYQKISVGDDYYYYNPHFARTVTVNDTKPAAPETVYVRTARQLYALSLYYPEYAEATADSRFLQELDIDYDSYLWNVYDVSGDITVQQPIGSGNCGFVAEYNGGNHTISGLSISSSESYIGLFGYVTESAILQNIFLTATDDVINYVNSTGGSSASGSGTRINMGAIAGYNNGTIRNSLASGYRMSFYGYRNSTLCLGGLVGINYGTIRACMADTPDITLANTNSTAYVGGFAGANHAAITSSYSLGVIDVLGARYSSVIIAGFTADNSSGIVRRSYSAVAITASGSAEAYGFAKSGGSVSSCYYLDGGTYSYAGELYAYNTSANQYSANAVGSTINGGGLRALDLGGFSKAQDTYAHPNTEEDSYPYPAVVQGANDRFVHYGDWPVQKDIGTLGVFYWEKETGGSNSGYHFSYIGTSQGAEIGSNGTDPDLLKGNSLCVAHDDGGYVTNYGYGYFWLDGDGVLDVSLDEGSGCVLGDRNLDAESELERQMRGYKFIAFETSEDGTHLTSVEPNATWTLSYGDVSTYTYTVSPFFANSMSLDSMNIEGIESKTGHDKPGTTDSSAYEIRSTAQLQFINWSYRYLTAHKFLVDKSDDYKYYPYLSYIGYIDSNRNDEGERSFIWNQSHDLDAYRDGSPEHFTPVGGLYDNMIEGDSSQLYAAYFSSKYNGQDYTIKNIEISTTAECIGLFGFTSGADMQNIVMYSDVLGGSTIENLPSGKNWYAMGGLVGFAGSRNSPTSKFVNCSVSGYNIVDRRAKGLEGNNRGETYRPGWGGGCVGGLVGATNMDIERCTAVTNIHLDIGYNTNWTNLRVGGLAGVGRGVIDSCYVGGSIKSTSNIGSSSPSNGSSIWVGGIVGGNVMRSGGNIADLAGETTNVLEVKNCYSFVKVPKSSSWGEYGVRNSQAIASNGELQKLFTTIKNSNIIIRNSYALIDNAVDADDYNYYKDNISNQRFSWNNISLDRGNNSGTGESARRIALYNDSTPYLTYTQMSDGTMLQKLRAGSNSFGTVTTTELGANIDGKYSYPGNDKQLQGLNYPFPTVLTQTDIFGKTVNVHYGEWPKQGLYWDSSSASMDLLADAVTGDDGVSRPLLTVRLHVTGITPGATDVPSFSFYDENDVQISPTSSPAYVYSVSAFNSTDGYYDVTFIGQSKGIMSVKASLGGNDAYLTLTVGAGMTLSSSSLNLTLFEGDVYELTLSVTDANNRLLSADECRRLSWKLSIDTNGAAQDPVECSADDIVYDEASGTFKLPVTGFAPGEAIIKISCTYTYTVGDGSEGSMQLDLYISATTKQSDVLGLSNGTSFNQTTVPHTPKAQQYVGKSVTYTGAKPSHSGTLFLYSTTEYTLLSGFTVKQISLRYDGSDHAVGGNGLTSDGRFHVEVGDADFASSSTYNYIPITVSSSDASSVTATVTLTRNGVDYVLTMSCTSETGPFEISYVDINGKALSTVSGRFGDNVKLPSTFDMSTLPQRAGYKYDQAVVFAPTVVYCSQKVVIEPTAPISYTVVFNSNGGTSYISGSMSSLTCQYDTTYTLPANGFTRQRYTFQGWATSSGGDVVYADMSQVKNLASTDGATVNLYAKWARSW